MRGELPLKLPERLRCFVGDTTFSLQLLRLPLLLGLLTAVAGLPRESPAWRVGRAGPVCARVCACARMCV